jgi:hypothetical protein
MRDGIKARCRSRRSDRCVEEKAKVDGFSSALSRFTRFLLLVPSQSSYSVGSHDGGSCWTRSAGVPDQAEVDLHRLALSLFHLARSSSFPSFF